MSATVCSSPSASFSIATSVASSRSALAISNSSFASRSPVSIRPNVRISDSRDFRSRPSSWARLLSLHTAGSSERRVTSVRRRCLASKSKIPPQLSGAALDVREPPGDGVDLFRFHGLSPKLRDYIAHRALSVADGKLYSPPAGGGVARSAGVVGGFPLPLYLHFLYGRLAAPGDFLCSPKESHQRKGFPGSPPLPRNLVWCPCAARRRTGAPEAIGVGQERPLGHRPEDSLFRYSCGVRPDKLGSCMQHVDVLQIPFSSAIIGGISEVHCALDRPKSHGHSFQQALEPKPIS